MSKERVTAAVFSLLICMYFFLAALHFAGCGGSGGSGNSSSGDDSPQTTSLVCSHDGDLWLCPETAGGSCVRDQSTSSEEITATEEAGRIVYRVKLTSGAITIIAECGSNVSFSNTEETDANTTVTTATANFGINQPAEVE